MKDIPLQKKNKKNILLFHPFIAKECKEILAKKLNTRWIGQGPAVDKFENLISKQYENKLPCISTNSGAVGWGGWNSVWVYFRLGYRILDIYIYIYIHILHNCINVL